MTRAEALEATLMGVSEPTGTHFNVREVVGYAGYRIGRGPEGAIVLLVPPDPKPEPPTRLRSLSLDPRVHCRVENSDGTMGESDQGLVQFLAVEGDMVRPFLGVAATLVRLLGPTPGAGEVSAAMRRLVGVFQSQRASRGSVIGFWGELKVIAGSSDPASLVDAWHSSGDQLFDFSTPGSRLEVKTTTRSSRIHVFNLLQLQELVGAATRVVSIMTTETDTGTSVSDLVEVVQSQLGLNSSQQMKVHEQAAAILGTDWARSFQRRFDQHEADRSLKVLDPGDLPQLETPSAEVIEVHLTIDCSMIPEAGARPGLSGLV